ncbi:MAG: polysaccharide pyruvyl transferase family protein, partial [Anaerolineales bacterium]
EHTRLAFERCQVATLRDDESLKVLVQTGLDMNSPSREIHILPDLVFSLQENEAHRQQADEILHSLNLPKGTEILGLSLLYWDIGIEPAEWMARVAEGIRAFLLREPSVHLLGIPFQVLEATPFTNDVLVIKQVATMINLPERIHIIEHALSPGLAQALIGRCSMLFGMRLHSLIMGFNNGVPSVAFSRASKVNAVMHLFGLDAYCLPLDVQPEGIQEALQGVWSQQEALRAAINQLKIPVQREAARHAEFASDLLSKTHRGQDTIQKEFALHQTRMLFTADTNIERLQKEKNVEIERLQNEKNQLETQLLNAKEQNVELELQNHALRKRVEELESVAKNISWLVNNKAYKYVIRFFSIWKEYGLKSALRVTAKVISGILGRERKPIPQNALSASYKIELEKIITDLNARGLKGVFVVTSAFEFDDFYNQRVINLSKHLAKQGWGVVYVAWRWSPTEAMNNICTEVYSNVFQIPIDVFDEHLSLLAALQYAEKHFVVEFPHPQFLQSGLQLKQLGFSLTYEIIDEWEEFQKVGQAPWFDKAVEQSLVLNANVLTAVSEPLRRKFGNIRHDILLIPNGYDPLLIGQDHQFIAQEKFSHSHLNIGYFGHLTKAWFDWDFVFSVLDLANKRGVKLHLHLIGYGGPDMSKRLKQYSENITFHGPVKPADLYKYAQKWDVAMIPFKSGRLSESVDPIKIYEYLYFGLPVIVKGISHLENLTPWVCLANDAPSFLAALDKLKQEVLTHAIPDDMDKLMKNSTWEARFNHLVKVLEDRQWMSL